jgi:hypothetical protein
MSESPSTLPQASRPGEQPHRTSLVREVRRYGTAVAVAAGFALGAPSETQEPVNSDSSTALVESGQTSQAVPDHEGGTSAAHQSAKSPKPHQKPSSNPTFTFTTGNPKSESSNPGLSQPTPQDKNNNRGNASEAFPGTGTIEINDESAYEMPAFELPHQETPLYDKLVDLHPENLSLSEAEAKYIEENAVLIPALGCSGLLVRDPETNQIIGVETATHCSLLKERGHRSTDETGNPVTTFNEPIIIYKGKDSSDVKRMTVVGKIKQFIYAADNDLTNDQAYGAFESYVAEGHTAEDVMKAAPQKSPEQIREQYKKGDIVNVGMYPANQPDNPGTNERQDTPGIVMGIENWHITNGEKIDVLVVAIPEKKNCTPRASGSVVFDLKEAAPSTFGVASGYISFDPRLNPYGAESAINSKRHAENLYGISMDKITGLCGFAINQPNVENGAVISNVLTPPVFELPDYDSTPQGQLEKRVRTEFFDPNFKDRNFIDGQALIRAKFGDTIVIDRPFVYHDKDTGMSFLGWYGNNGADGLVLWPLHNTSDLYTAVSIYQRSGQGVPSIQNSQGSLNPVSDENPGFHDGTNNFGIYSGDTPSDSATLSKIIIGENGKPALRQEAWTPQENMEIATRHFNNPDRTKTVFDNTILRIRSNKYDGSMYINNASAEIVNGGVVVMYAGAEDGKLKTSFFSNPSQLELYNTPGEAAEVYESIGPVTPVPALEGQIYEGYLDGKGFGFGEVIRTVPDNLGSRLIATYENGEWTLKPATTPPIASPPVATPAPPVQQPPVPTPVSVP